MFDLLQYIKYVPIFLKRVIINIKQTWVCVNTHDRISEYLSLIGIKIYNNEYNTIHVYNISSISETNVS